jgi:EmrB/QacA subfamily drug resistance transporter
MLAATFLAVWNTTIVNVAIPAIHDQLGASGGQAEWVIGAYALAYGVALLPGGRLGDARGRRRVFVLGVAVFTAGAALAGAATGPQVLIAASAIQGAGAGLMVPQVIASIPVGFAPARRGTAFGLYGATTSLGAAVGPLVGGWLVGADVLGLSWRAVFLVDVPIGLLALPLALWLVPESRGNAVGVDLLGAGLLCATLLALLVPLTSGAEGRWPLWTLLTLLAAAPTLAVFVLHQARRGRAGHSPLLDLDLLRVRSFTAAALVGLAYFATFQGLLFTVSVFVQSGLRGTALDAGLVLSAFAIGALLSSTLSGRVTGRFGPLAPRLGAVGAGAGLAAAMAGVQAIGAGAVPAVALAPGLFVAGLGHGLIVAPNVNLGLRDVPRAAAGMAGGAISTAQRIGQSLGVAVAGAVYFAALPSGAAGAMRSALVVGLLGLALTLGAALLIPRTADVRRRRPA